MKRRIITMLGIISVVIGLAACEQVPANEGDSSADSTVSDTVSEEKEGETSEQEEDINEMELPYWKGVWDHYGNTVVGVGSVSIYLQYPSLKPTSYGWAYQLDPTYVAVLSSGYDKDGKEIEIDTLENAFEVTKPEICRTIKNRRKSKYADFDFIVETAEAVTINEFPMYKYTGKHTYTYDGEQRECDFVAYSVDTKQVEHSYPTLIVIDDSLSHPEADPVPEGTIEAYARKMAESIEIRQH